MAIIFDEQGRPITGDNPFPVSLSGSKALPSSHASTVVSTTAVPLPNIPAGATKALISIEMAAVRACWDGTTPTASVGHYYPSGDYIQVTNRDDLEAFRVIRADGVDAVLRVTYS